MDMELLISSTSNNLSLHRGGIHKKHSSTLLAQPWIYRIV